MTTRIRKALAVMFACMGILLPGTNHAQNLAAQSQELAALIKLKNGLEASFKVVGSNAEVYFNGVLKSPSLDRDSIYTFSDEGTYRFRSLAGTSNLGGIFRSVHYRNDSIQFSQDTLLGTYQEIIINYTPNQSMIVGQDILLDLGTDSIAAISNADGSSVSIDTNTSKEFPGIAAFNIFSNTYSVDSGQIMVFYPLGNGRVRMMRRSNSETVLHKSPMWPLLKALISSDQSKRPELDFLDDLRKNEYLQKDLAYWLNLRDHVFMEILDSTKTNALLTTPTSQKLNEINSAEPAKRLEKIINASNETASKALVNATQEVYSTKSFLSSINQAAILEGLTSFIEKRAQEELNILFLNRLSKKLDDSEIGILFPKTKLLFERF
ncbi:MAG: hypothetical protein AAF242_16755, partial [Bacteroidota bacterium]